MSQCRSDLLNEYYTSSKIIRTMAYDVFFLSYGESVAESNWHILRNLAPHASRVSGVDGIFEAHKLCAKKSMTRYFYVIDADNEVLPTFDFGYKSEDWMCDYVQLWYSRNPVNGLEYGWGGIKLFNRDLVLRKSEVGVDMTTSFPLHIHPTVASITHFNSTPFDAWRSGFREAAKLKKSLMLEWNEETNQRLDGWGSSLVGDNHEYVLSGVNAGIKYAESNDDISKVNDWGWLRAEFENDTRK